MKGRYNRSRYVWMTLGISLVTYALAFLVGIIMGTEESASAIGGIMGLVSSIVLAFVTVKRLHDLDRPGWHYWLLLVPFYNIYLSIVLLFVKGTPGANRFGMDSAAA